MDILKSLEEAGGVLLDRHFVYTSGKHGSGYINLDLIFPNVDLLTEICDRLIEPFLGEFDTIAAPAVGGVALSVLAGRAAKDRGYDVATVWADKQDGDFVFERAGFVQRVAARRVLAVEDLLTTGGSVLKLCRRAETEGARIVGVSVVCNRGDLTAQALGVPRLEALAEVSFEAVAAEDCKLCANDVPIVEDVGHGADYKTAHPDYTGGFVRATA